MDADSEEICLSASICVKTPFFDKETPHQYQPRARNGQQFFNVDRFRIVPENHDGASPRADAGEALQRALAAEEADRVLARFWRDRLDIDLEDSSALRSFRSDIEFAHRKRIQQENRTGFWKLAYVAGVTAVVSAIVTYIASCVSAWVHLGKPPS
jgi:hypothetical protein